MNPKPARPRSWPALRSTLLLALVVVASAALLSAPARACFTSERAAELGKLHPDLAFEDLAHHMHHQERIGYEWKGPAPCVGGTSDIFSCSGIELAGWLELSEIGGGSGNDNWGWQDPLSGRYYALMGRSNGVALVDITEPDAPVYLGNLPRPDGVGASVWTDIKTYADHAFIVADSVQNHGLQVFDLRRLREVTGPPVTFSHDARYGGFNRAHNVFVNEDTGYAYAVGSDTCGGGLHMVNVQNPLQPQFAGCYSADGYTHDVQCVVYQGPHSEYQGREICFASNENSVTIVDVTDKSSPVMVGRHTYAQTGYTHQGWLTGDQRYFVFDDELDEMQLGLEGTRSLIFDFQRLDVAPDPAEYIADGLSIDHNQYVIGDYTFQANYKRGLRVLRLDDPGSGALTEVAYFDTHPEGEGLGFSGAWNAFPFFDNGTILVSDINRGLFVLRVTAPELVELLDPVIFIDAFEPAG